MSEEDGQIFFKIFYEEHDCKVTTLSSKQLFKLDANLIKKHDKMEKSNIELKEYIEFLENINEILGNEIAKISIHRAQYQSKA